VPRPGSYRTTSNCRREATKQIANQRPGERVTKLCSAPVTARQPPPATDPRRRHRVKYRAGAAAAAAAAVQCKPIPGRRKRSSSGLSLAYIENITTQQRNK